jgi:uncharacterized membrane protein (DUF4010 family)
MELTSSDWNLAIALGIGLLLGAERERRKGEGPGRAFAGIRTFALVALLGGLAHRLGEPTLVVAGCFVGAGTIAAYVVSPRRTRDPGMTTEVAVVVTFLLGALAQTEPELASAIAVVTAILLAGRQQIHGFVRGALTEAEVHDALLLAAAALVILPLLPDEAVDPYDVINPFTIWRLVVVVMAISAAGHVATRVLGPRFGLPVAGLASGFVSGIATVGSMANRARLEPILRQPAVAGAVLATVATVAQMAIVTRATSADTFEELVVPLALAGAAALGCGLVFALYALKAPVPAPGSLREGDAVNLRTALIFAATVTAVLFVSAAAQDLLGDTGIFIATLLAGFVDSHSAAISAASLVVAGKAEAANVVAPILAGLTANTLVKTAVAVQGGRWFATRVWSGLALVTAGSWAGWLINQA